MPDAGWYPDPQDPASIRYYDGSQWTEHRQPPHTPAESPADVPADSAVAQPDEPAQQPDQPAPYGPPADETVARSQLPQPEYGQPAHGQQPTTAYDQPAYGQQPTTQFPNTYSETAAYPAAAPTAYPTAQYEPAYPAPTPGYGTVPPPPKKKSNHALLIVGIVAVLVIAGGAAWFLLKPDKPKLTYEGKSIKDASTVLQKAESNLDAVVKERHGATNGDTRCYYAVPNDEPSGAKSSDVDSRLRCGPVLFVDGDADAAYLPFSLTATPAGGDIALDVNSQPASNDPSPIGSFKLKRPDGKTPPSGSGGLKVPAPPAAEANTVTATDLGPVTPPASAPATAIIGSYNVGVQLVRAGVTNRFGSGDDARSAPSGSQIVVFQVTPMAGDIEDKSDELFSDLTVLAGGKSIEVPEPNSASDYLAAVVPAGSDPVLQLTDAGISQTLSLPGGAPGSHNIAVLARTHRKAGNTRAFDTALLARQGTATGTENIHASYTGADLDYWNPDVTTSHPTSPAFALLRVLLNYQDKARPGTDYGFEPQVLSLKLPNGQVIKATNIASGDFIINVFQVPGNFTTGTIQVAGSYVQDGVTVTVSPAISLPVTITAG